MGWILLSTSVNPLTLNKLIIMNNLFVIITGVAMQAATDGRTHAHPATDLDFIYYTWRATKTDRSAKE